MEHITLDMLDNVTIADDVILEKVCNVSRDDDAKRAGINKQVVLEVAFGGVTLRSLFNAALKPTVIKWQRPARSRYDTLPKRERIHYKSAGQRDARDVMLEKAPTMPEHELRAYIEQLEEIASRP
jgi:hypothetical protein